MPRAIAIGIVGAFLFVSVGGLDVSASQPPAPIGTNCTAYGLLRGSDVGKLPASGDVATVAQLCQRDASVGALERVPFVETVGAAVSETRLLRDASLHPLTSIGAPDSTSIDLRSRNGNWTHLYSGAFWRSPAITASGEIQAIDRGHAQFSVAASLSYFAVVLPRFLARVKGTVFDTDFEAASASFSVSEGAVAITRTVAIRLRDEKRSIDGIRFTDIITAGGVSSISYKLPLGIEREFQNQSEAERTLTQQLQQAIAGGDPQAVDDAVYNLQVVTGQTVVGFARPTQNTNASASNASPATNTAAVGASHLSVGIIAGAAAAAIGIAASVISGSAPAQPFAAAPAQGATPVPGGVTLTSLHATPTPRPSLTPRPIATPLPVAVRTPLTPAGQRR